MKRIDYEKFIYSLSLIEKFQSDKFPFFVSFFLVSYLPFLISYLYNSFPCSQFYFKMANVDRHVFSKRPLHTYF